MNFNVSSTVCYLIGYNIDDKMDIIMNSVCKIKHRTKSFHLRTLFAPHYLRIIKLQIIIYEITNKILY